MRIWQRVRLDTDGIVRAKEYLANDEMTSIVEHDAGHGFVDIAETHPLYPKLLMDPGVKKITLANTTFNKEEKLAAEYSLLHVWHGIPYPVGDYLNTGEYNLPHEATACWCAWRRAKPFVIAKEGKVGRNHIFAFWGGFEMLCLTEVAEALAQAGFTGFDVWPIRLKSGGESTNWREIVATRESAPAFDRERAHRSHLDYYPWDECNRCARPYLSEWRRGPIPLRRSALLPDMDFQYLYEYINNHRYALVSQRVVRFMMDQGWRGMDFYPAELTD